jgi:hypothetical protein
MAIAIDGLSRRIVLDSGSVTAEGCWTAWVDWHANNRRWPLALKLVGGIELGGGLFIPPYFFLLNDWRIRPMEGDHDLDFQGNLFVEGGGNPFVRTLGPYQVNVRSTVPVQAQGIATSGSTGPSASSIAAAILTAAQITPIYSDVRKVNSVNIVGTGASSDKWRSSNV